MKSKLRRFKQGSLKAKIKKIYQTTLNRKKIDIEELFNDEAEQTQNRKYKIHKVKQC